MLSKPFEKAASLSWILTLLLIAGSAFVLGQNLNSKAPSSDVVENISETLTPPSPVISDIEQVINNGSAQISEASSQVTGLVNINTGTAAELDSLPGIGPSKAQAIIDYRLQNGLFIRVEDLTKVKGIGPKTFDTLKNQITI